MKLNLELTVKMLKIPAFLSLKPSRASIHLRIVTSAMVYLPTTVQTWSHLKPFPFLTCAGCKAMQHAKKMSAPPVCGFLSKLAEAYGKKTTFSSGNEPVKHIIWSYSVSFWSYTPSPNGLMCFHWAQLEHLENGRCFKPLLGRECWQFRCQEELLVVWLFFKVRW